MPISLQAFTAYVQKYGLIAPGQKILLAFSGGVDSVVLATLLKEAGADVALAHCNFQLRGSESNGDESFAITFAHQLKVPLYKIRFDAAGYIKQHKVSTQVGARELRYEWFKELMEEHGYQKLATAHHQTDQAETLLLNITRGTGLAGLQGIKPIENNIIRPLLFATRADIEEYAKAKKLKWREDSSNTSNKYSRNKLRNVVLPVLKGINPAFEQSFYNLSVLAGQYQQLLQNTITANTQGMVVKEGRILKIDREKLAALPLAHLYLYELLKPYAIKGDMVAQIAQALTGHSGTVFYCGSAKVLIDRQYLLVEEDAQPLPQGCYLTENAEKFSFGPGLYTVEKTTAEGFEISRDPAIAQLDADKLQYPLLVRAWQQGDYFYPLGMRKKKKVSDFFIDQKIPLFHKSQYPLVFSGNHLVCIGGLRVDDRFKITGKTKNILVISSL